MIRSMTGFGSAKGKAAGLSLSVELRSVNNRYLDVSVKLPRGFLFAESFVKNYLQETVSRGKIDVFFTLDLDEGDRTRIRINQNLAPVINIFFTVPLNFLLNKFWAYRKK